MASTTNLRLGDGASARPAASWRPIETTTGDPAFSGVLQRDPMAGADVRRMVRAVLTAWELLDLEDDVRLVSTELVSNAAKHARGDVVRVTLTRTGLRRVRVAVTDRSRGELVMRPVDEDSESGRGLHLVRALASRTGVVPLPWGKSVWAEVGTA
ncbi:hypothetical protein B0E38_01860 [Streptomyces sp. 111WW2]|uniref:ATP-binding protein n=1 Tax=Streptomyces sp. 111WW2 TaxID=1945515 RepID=UPI000D0C77EE|nr:ATP-binding protein [Streptomyces sp. 111WW2]PSK58015.1 hypothetical protein B0E38_01860 [Streptomyces sp. 111WW2]